MVERLTENFRYSASLPERWASAQLCSERLVTSVYAKHSMFDPDSERIVTAGINSATLWDGKKRQCRPANPVASVRNRRAGSRERPELRRETLAAPAGRLD